MRAKGIVKAVRCIAAIDGPSGAGKSTISKLLAVKLGWMYIDTGAMYRVAALFAREAGINLKNGDKVAALCKTLSFAFQLENTLVRVTCNGRDVTSDIRTHEMGMLASDVSKHLLVRETLVDLQRDLGKAHHAVLEGRDIGTVVFPNAMFKFYLDASLDERARRRHNELKKKGEIVSFEEVRQAIEERDINDSTREVSPLRQASDAIRIDSTGKDIPEVLMEIYHQMKGRLDTCG